MYTNKIHTAVGFSAAPGADIVAERQAAQFESDAHIRNAMRKEEYTNTSESFTKEDAKARRDELRHHMIHAHTTSRLRKFQQKTSDRGTTQDNCPVYPHAEESWSIFSILPGCGSARQRKPVEDGVRVCDGPRFSKPAAPQSQYHASTTSAPATPRTKQHRSFTQEELRFTLAQAPFEKRSAYMAADIGQVAVEYWKETNDKLNGTEEVPEGYHMIHVINLHDLAIDQLLHSSEWGTESLLRDITEHLTHGDLVATCSVRHPQEGRVIDGIVQGHVYDILSVRRASNNRFLIKMSHHEAVHPRDHVTSSAIAPTVRAADEQGFFVPAEELATHFDLILIYDFDKASNITKEILQEATKAHLTRGGCSAPAGWSASTPLWSWWIPADGPTVDSSLHSEVEPLDPMLRQGPGVPLRTQAIEAGKMGFNGGANINYVRPDHNTWNENVLQKGRSGVNDWTKSYHG
jgi:hypothetical protein